MDDKTHAATALDDQQMDAVAGGSFLDDLKDAVTAVVPGHEKTVSAVATAAGWIRDHI